MKIRMSKGQWREVRDWARGRASRRAATTSLSEREVPTDLESMGLWSNGSLTVPAKKLMAGYSRATGHIRVEVVAARRLGSFDCWLNESRDCTSALDDGDTMEIDEPGHGMVPIVLQRMLRIHPHRQEEISGEAAVAAPIITALFDRDVNRYAAAENLALAVRNFAPEACDAIVDDEWQAWRLRAEPMRGDSPRSKAEMLIVETSRGFLALESGEGEYRVSAMRSADVWAMLTAFIAPAC